MRTEQKRRLEKNEKTGKLEYIVSCVDWILIMLIKEITWPIYFKLAGLLKKLIFWNIVNCVDFLHKPK